jgi:hypothetical protein
VVGRLQAEDYWFKEQLIF